MNGLYREFWGQGSEALLIHGWGMHGEVWRGVAEQLAVSYRVQVVDLPGMGHSVGCAVPHVEALVAELASELHAPAVVCGWSQGGQLAMQLAAHYPEKVSRLLLVNSTPKFVMAPDWPHGVSADIFQAFARQVAVDYRTAIDHFFAIQATSDSTARSLIRALRQTFTRRPQASAAHLQHYLAWLLHDDLRELLSTLKLPVFVLHGDQDRVVPLSAGQWLAGQGAELQVIPAAAHVPFLSHPDEFMTAVWDCLRAHPV